MADTRQEIETAVFDLAGRVASVRAALSGAIMNDVDGVGAVRPGPDALRGGPEGTARSPT